MDVTHGVGVTDVEGDPPAMVGRLVAAEAAAVSELSFEPTPEVEAVVAAEIEALDGLEVDALVEAEASLRVLLAEPDTADAPPDELRHASVEDAAETLRRLVPEAHLAEG